MPLNVTHNQLISQFAKQHSISGRKAEGIFRSVDKNITGFGGRQIGNEKKAKSLLDKAYQVAKEQGISLKGYSAGTAAQRNTMLSRLRSLPTGRTAPASKQKNEKIIPLASQPKKPAEGENVFQEGEFGHRQARYALASEEKRFAHKAAGPNAEAKEMNRPGRAKTEEASVKDLPIAA